MVTSNVSTIELWMTSTLFPTCRILRPSWMARPSFQKLTSYVVTIKFLLTKVTFQRQQSPLFGLFEFPFGLKTTPQTLQCLVDRDLDFVFDYSLFPAHPQRSTFTIFALSLSALAEHGLAIQPEFGHSELSFPRSATGTQPLT